MTYTLKKHSNKILILCDGKEFETSNSIEDLYNLIREKEIEEMATKYFESKMEKAEGFEMTFGWRKRFKEIYDLASESFHLSEAEAIGFFEWMVNKDGPDALIGPGKKFNNVDLLKQLFSLYKQQLMYDRVKECEVEIEMQCQHKGIHNSTCIYEPKLTDEGKVTITKII